MSVLFLALTTGACITFFYFIGLWYLGFIPALFFLFLLGYYTSLASMAMGYVRDWQQYAIYAAWICILVGIGGILHFLGIDFVSIVLCILAINSIGWIGSYMSHYQDGKYIFQIGYYMSVVLICMRIRWLEGVYSILDTITVLWALHIAIVSFIVYVVGIFRKIEHYMLYTLGVLVVGEVFLIVLQSISNVYIALLINSLVLVALYHGILYVLAHAPSREQSPVQVSIRRILAGERITKKRVVPMMNGYVRYVYDFVVQIPRWTQHILQSMNTIVILSLIIVYILSFSSQVLLWEHLVYWAIMVVFVYNVFLLQKLHYATLMQKISLFVVLHFAVYVSLFYFLKGNWNDIARWGMVWNISASGLIIYIPREYMEKILNVQDYFYWIFITIIVMIVNILILSRGTLPGQLIFSFSFLYMGVQAMLLYYVMQRIKTYTVEETYDHAQELS